jgi:hypothetical protein
MTGNLCKHLVSSPHKQVENRAGCLLTFLKMRMQVIGPAALQRKSHLCIFFWELRGLSPNFGIHVSVSDLYIPRISPHIWLYGQTEPGMKYINLTQNL